MAANPLFSSSVNDNFAPRLSDNFQPTLSDLAFDFNSALNIAQDVIPDGWQKTGQDIIDAAKAPAAELVKSISPELYATLDAEAQKAIDKARSDIGLPAVKAPATTQTTTQQKSGSTVATTATGVVNKVTDFGKRNMAPIIGGVAGGAVTYVVSGRIAWTKKSTARRVGVTFIGAGLGWLAGGFVKKKTA